MHVYVSSYGQLWRLTAAQWERYLRDTIAGRVPGLVSIGAKFCGRVHDVTEYETPHADAALELIGAEPEPHITDGDITAALGMPDVSPSIRFEASVALGDPRLARSYRKPERVRAARNQLLAWINASRGEPT